MPKIMINIVQWAACLSIILNKSKERITKKTVSRKNNIV